MTRTPVDLALEALHEFTPTTPAQVHMLLELWRGRWCLDDAHKATIVARKVGWLSSDTYRRDEPDAPDLDPDDDESRPLGRAARQVS